MVGQSCAQTEISRTMKCKRIKKDGNKSCVILGCNDVSGKIEELKNGMSRDLLKEYSNNEISRTSGYKRIKRSGQTQVVDNVKKVDQGDIDSPSHDRPRK